jgi:hypothetical protein
MTGGNLTNLARHRLYRLLMVGLLFLAAGLRLALGVVNRQANDDHLEVVQLIAATGQLPDQPDCHECQQAKLYHLSVAALLPVLAPAGAETAILLAQGLNVVLSLTTLAVVAWYIDRQGWPLSVRLLAVALLAFNPAWVGINVQATNDTFVICWSTLALTAALTVLARLRARKPVPLLPMMAMLLCAGAAAASKANGLLALVLALLVLGLCAVETGRGRTVWARRTLVGSGAALAASLLLTLSIGQYWHNFVTYGKPVTINFKAEPSPGLFEPTYTFWAGITSVPRGYFSFDLPSLLRDPYVLYNDDPPTAVFPEHRTSLWAQLYGTAYSLHFHEHPPSWASWHPVVLNLARASFILALLPTGLVLVGVAKTAKRLMHLIEQRQWRALLTGDGWLWLAGLAGSLTLYVLYSAQCRSFVCHKAIFVLPASIVLLPLFAAGYVWLAARRPFRPGTVGQWVLTGWLALAPVSFVAEAGVLFWQLAR